MRRHDLWSVGCALVVACVGTQLSEPQQDGGASFENEPRLDEDASATEREATDTTDAAQQSTDAAQQSTDAQAADLPSCEPLPLLAGVCARVADQRDTILSNDSAALEAEIIAIGDSEANPACFGPHNWGSAVPAVIDPQDAPTGRTIFSNIYGFTHSASYHEPDEEHERDPSCDGPKFDFFASVVHIE